MLIKSIHWLDRESKEAGIEVIDDNYQIICFSHPCKYLQGERINEILHCLDVI